MPHKLNLTESWFHTALDSIGDAVITTDTKNRITFMNPAAETLTEWAREEVLGRPLMTVVRLINEKTHARVINPARNVLKTGIKIELTHPVLLIRKDGSEIPIDDSASPIKDEGGNIIGVVLILKDIADRRKAELALKESEERNRLLIQESPLGIFMMDTEGNLQILNESMVRIMGYPSIEDARNINLLTFPPLIKSGISALLLKCMKTGQTLSGEIPYRNRSGNSLILKYLGDPVRDATGALIGVQCMIEDVSHQKEAEMKIRESEEKFVSIFEHAADGILYAGKDGTVSEVNPAFERMTNIRKEDLVGKKASDLVHKFVDPSKISWMLANVSHFLSGKPLTPYELKFRDKILEIIPTFTKGRRGITAIVRDITERKHAEEKTRKDLDEKEVLIKEIHHRVKNNLQVISSLLSLQAHHIKDPATLNLFRESQDRIRSLALVHENLYRSPNLAEVDVEHYLHTVLSGLYHSYCTDARRISYEVHIEKTALSVDLAVPCGLIINELFSNALKHAFPATWKEKGKITVAFNRVEKDTYRMIVQDNGRSIPEEVDVHKTESLGLHLVYMLSVKQLKGSCEVSRQGGTTFTITFKQPAE